MIAANAERLHLQNILNYKPNETYMLMVVASPEDRAAYERIFHHLLEQAAHAVLLIRLFQASSHDRGIRSGSDLDQIGITAEARERRQAWLVESGPSGVATAAARARSGR